MQSPASALPRMAMADHERRRKHPSRHSSGKKMPGAGRIVRPATSDLPRRKPTARRAASCKRVSRPATMPLVRRQVSHRREPLVSTPQSHTALARPDDRVAARPLSMDFGPNPAVARPTPSKGRRADAAHAAEPGICSRVAGQSIATRSSQRPRPDQPTSGNMPPRPQANRPGCRVAAAGHPSQSIRTAVETRAAAARVLALSEPRWRNWQTHQLEGLAPFTGRAGSSPVLGTIQPGRRPTARRTPTLVPAFAAAAHHCVTILPRKRM